MAGALADKVFLSVGVPAQLAAGSRSVFDAGRMRSTTTAMR